MASSWDLGKAFLNVRVLLKLQQLLHNFPFDPQRIREIQCAGLKKLLVHSYETFAFYRKRMDDSGFDPRNVRSIEDLRKLPPLTKEEYRSFVQQIVEQKAKHFRSWFRDGTSGSTGTPLTIYRDWEERAYQIAKWLRELFVNGYRPTYRTLAIVSPHRLSARDSLLQRVGLFRRRLVSYTEPVERMVEAFEDEEPHFLYANKSQLVQMAEYIAARHLCIRRPVSYACGAETLDGNSKVLIQSVFGVDNFFETYGCVELGILAFQCKGEDGLHICHDTDIVELESVGAKAGACLVTDLCISTFPLIRYQLGDWLETEIRDGLPVISRIRGRLDDWVRWRDGTRIPFHAFYEVMERRQEVKQFRIIQESYDCIRVLAVLASSANAQTIRARLQQDLMTEVRPDVGYQIEFVDAIPPDETGKLRMVVSKVTGGNA